MSSLDSKPKPYKPQTLEPSIKESLRRVSRWCGGSYTRQGVTGKSANEQGKKDKS